MTANRSDIVATMDAMIALTDVGVRVEMPTMINGKKVGWSVSIGSHGAERRTLPLAMRACLETDNIGSFWKADDGILMRDHFERICRECFNAPLYKKRK